MTKSALLAFAAGLTLLLVSHHGARADATDRYSRDPARDHPGRILHYLRTNLDGSEPEKVSVFRRDRDHIEVYKHVAPCVNAALVTAELHPTLPVMARLAGGRLQPDARHVEFAWMTYDAGARTLTARVGQGPEAQVKTVTVAAPVWRLFDFDLADMTVMAPHLKDPKAGFSFSLPLIWTGDAGWDFRDLGRVDAVFEREEVHAGRPALRFRVSGPGLAGKEGPLWLDAADGHVLGAAWGAPNHAEYDSFKLEYLGLDDGGLPAWEALLRAHFAGCPGK